MRLADLNPKLVNGRITVQGFKLDGGVYGDLMHYTFPQECLVKVVGKGVTPYAKGVLNG